MPPDEPTSHVPPQQPEPEAPGGEARARPELPPEGDSRAVTDDQPTQFHDRIFDDADDPEATMVHRGPGHTPYESQPRAAQPPYQAQPSYPPIEPQQYGAHRQQPAASSGVASTTAWPIGTAAAEADERDELGFIATILLAVGGLLALGYAVWAFTARRGVFADFADGVAVSIDDARSSDQIDTVFAIVAGLVALAALVLWVVRKSRGSTSGGMLEAVALALAVIGAVAILVGLFLSNSVADGGTTAEQGDKGVTATLVMGGGFTVLAIGLLLGLLTARGDPKRRVRGW